jgi:D-alanine-D-alanine ligase
VIEIVPCTGNYDFAAKYERNDTEYILDPQLPDQTCVSWAKEIVKKMNIRDLARVDFIIDDDGPWFLEVNTMPGFTEHSLLPMAASHAGLDMTALCTKLIEAATQDF